MAVRRISRSPGVEERPRRLEIAPMRRPVQRGSPVRGSRVRVATGVEDRPDRSEVVRAGGVNELRAGAGRRVRDERDSRRKACNRDSGGFAHA